MPKSVNDNACISDMTPERNALMEQAYPRLKEYCRTQYRFEFQVRNESAFTVQSINNQKNNH